MIEDPLFKPIGESIMVLMAAIVRETAGCDSAAPYYCAVAATAAPRTGLSLLGNRPESRGMAL